MLALLVRVCFLAVVTHLYRETCQHLTFATHLFEDGVDMRYIQELPGHGSIKTTERYTHVTQKGKGRIKSPLDNMPIQ